ncbi:hypothetical protein K2173_016881 [Erythroxylum novogranatense]|uniref:Uncharacterized protein n=1 Tax=Erythroxylum novogranatense TaxID=1862640 RepID=A0AAV8U918_9ROSI|nr:hypothetical protein K2173_016881 [Erythroxylum novogranatense]
MHVRYVSVQGGEKGSKKLPLSNLRVLVVAEEGGEIGIIEEFVSKEGSSDRYYWANSVLEVVVRERAKEFLHSAASNRKSRNDYYPGLVNGVMHAIQFVSFSTVLSRSIFLVTPRELLQINPRVYQHHYPNTIVDLYLTNSCLCPPPPYPPSLIKTPNPSPT